jgi:hypothetical protein
LKDLNLVKDKDYFIFKRKAGDDDDESKCYVLISITIPDKFLNEHGEKLGIETTLTYTFTNIFVKGAYNDKLKHCFNKFDGDEKLTIIEDFLGAKIDFEYYLMTGVIEDHFPLHKKNEV